MRMTDTQGTGLARIITQSPPPPHVNPIAPLQPIAPMQPIPGAPVPTTIVDPSPVAVDPRTYVAPGMADIFTPDMKGWLATIVPGSYQYNSLPPMQKYWIDHYHAAPAATQQPRTTGTERQPPAPVHQPPIDAHVGRPINQPYEDPEPPPGWMNSSMGGVPVHVDHPNMGAILAEGALGIGPGHFGGIAQGPWVRAARDKLYPSPLTHFARTRLFDL